MAGGRRDLTVTTITTVGYGEVRPLDTAGRLFTIVLALAGVAGFFYTMGVVMEYLVSVRLADPGGRRRMERRIAELSGHVIVAGLGRVGRQAAQELHDARTPFVVVDPGPAAAHHAEERGYLFLQAAATEDAVLARAGIERARGLIVTTASDAANMYIVLSARVLNPRLTIVSRAADEASVTKLIRAGANRVISPYAIRRPPPRAPDPEPGRGRLLRDGDAQGDRGPRHRGPRRTRGQPGRGEDAGGPDIRRATGATILAVLREGNPLVSSPGDLVLAAGDHLLVLGTGAQLRELERLIASR